MKVNNDTSMTNGSVQGSREAVNTSVSNYAGLGKTNRVQWSKFRRYRSI